jgi:hypothetical protein
MPLEIGRVSARGKYTLTRDDDQLSYDPSPVLHSTNRFDDLLVCLYDQHKVDEIENVNITAGDTYIPIDVMREIFSAMQIIEKRA